MRKKSKKLSLAKETLANLDYVRGGIELTDPDYRITNGPSCRNTDCYCPGTADCPTDGPTCAASICIPL